MQTCNHLCMYALPAKASAMRDAAVFGRHSSGLFFGKARGAP